MAYFDRLALMARSIPDGSERALVKAGLIPGAADSGTCSRDMDNYSKPMAMGGTTETNRCGNVR